MTYKEFIKLVDQTHNNYNWRYGQSLMNVLHGAWPEKYNSIINTEKDCYYNDSLVPSTLSFLEKEWEK